MASDEFYEWLMEDLDDWKRLIDQTSDGMETTPPAYRKRSRMRRSSKSIVRSFYLRGVITLCGYM